MRATEKEVDSGLAGSVVVDVRRDGDAANASGQGRKDHKLRSVLGFALFQQWVSSLVEHDGCNGVDFKMFVESVSVHHVHWASGLRVEDSGIGNDRIEMMDVVLFLDLLKRGLDGGAVTRIISNNDDT